jgi:hypothetical protein
MVQVVSFLYSQPDISTLSIQFNEYDLSSGQPVKLPSACKPSPFHETQPEATYHCPIRCRLYILMLYKWLNGMFLYQFRPSFFYTREDLVTWLFMRTGIHQWFLNSNAGCVLLDVLFYSALFFYWRSMRSRI